MKRIIIVVLAFAANTLFAQDIDKEIVNDYKHLPQVGGHLFVKEIIEIYKTDTTIIDKIYNREVDDRSQGGAYTDTICSNTFYNSLFKFKNDSNSEIVESMISKLKRINLKIPYYNVNWGDVYVCGTKAPFGHDPTETWYYMRFALIYMGVNEIKQMIAFDNGEQWEYMLQDIRNGVLFDGIESTKLADRVIDRRIMQFLIDKWSLYQIPAIQELVKVLEDNLPLGIESNPSNIINGTWRGAFGNKIINLALNYDASIAETEKNEIIKKKRWRMFADENFGIIGNSFFDGQDGSKAIQAKGFYTESGKNMRITLIEQPDTAQWNGIFYIHINRKSKKIDGSWNSNNGKIQRLFELEKVKE